jgi:hypothetical protein
VCVTPEAPKTVLLVRFQLAIAALWWGGMSGLSFVAVPTLFASLGSPALAGPVAARLFSLQCWAGLLLGLVLLLLLRRERAILDQDAATPEQVQRLQRTLASMGWVMFAMILALLQEFGVAQRIVSARASGGDLRLWHSLGSLMVLGQWVSAGVLLWRLSAVPQAKR